QVGVPLAVPFHEPVKADGAGRHVDSHSEGVGGEHHLDKPGGEELLDRLFEHGKHSCAVGGDAVEERVLPASKLQHLKIFSWQAPGVSLNDGVDLVLLGFSGERYARYEHLLPRVVTAGPGEDENNRGQQRRTVEPVDHRSARWWANERR